MMDFIRIACAVPPVKVANPQANAGDICNYIVRADEQGVDVLTFPELALTGYTCGDLFFQKTLLQSAMEGLKTILDCSRAHPAVTVAVGLPVLVTNQMYNCCAVLCAGTLMGLVPKTYLPNNSEFYERRWFSSSEDLQQKTVLPSELGLSGTEPIPVGRNLLFTIGEGTVLGAEICEDLWTAMPPSTLMMVSSSAPGSS